MNKANKKKNKIMVKELIEHLQFLTKQILKFTCPSKNSLNSFS